MNDKSDPDVSLPPIGVLETVEALPAEAGAYGLFLELPHPVRVQFGKRTADFGAGQYMYAGSARGPGGIRARVGRHLKTAKSVRWHIDHLTNAVGVFAVVTFIGGDECILGRAAVTLPGAHIPAPGFGSTDCSTCESHLIKLPDGFEVASDFPLLASSLSDDKTGAKGANAGVWQRPRID